MLGCDTAILLVCMQDGQLMTGRPGEYVEVDEQVNLLTAQHELLQHARRNNLLTLDIRFRNSGPLTRHLQSALGENSLPYVVDSANAFSCQSVAHVLKAEGIRKVCITGVTALGAPYMTALNAKYNNLEVITARQLLAEYARASNEYKVQESFGRLGHYAEDYRTLLL
jgi:nicotinamidase-related amidase